MNVVGGANDPGYVAREYASEAGLAARKAAYRETAGEDPRDIAFKAVADASPADVLEVGCGEGELAERIGAELQGARVVAVDLSPRMVELAWARGVAAQVADVQDLPFDDESFDVVLAAWMLYHVPEPDRGLAEIVRVLRPGGRLVAVTNRADHLAELLQLGGIERWDLPFGGENGEGILEKHFASVARRDVDGTVTFSDIESVRSYFSSGERLRPHLEALPAALEEPLVARRCPVVFVAETAA